MRIFLFLLGLVWVANAGAAASNNADISAADLLRRCHAKFAAFKSWSYETRSPNGYVVTRHRFLRLADKRILSRTEVTTSSRVTKIHAKPVPDLDINFTTEDGTLWLLQPEASIAIDISGLGSNPDRAKLRRRIPPPEAMNLFKTAGTAQDPARHRSVEGVDCLEISVLLASGSKRVFIVSANELLPRGLIEFNANGVKTKEELYYSFSVDDSADPRLYEVPEDYTRFYPQTRRDFEAIYAQMKRRDFSPSPPHNHADHFDSRANNP